MMMKFHKILLLTIALSSCNAALEDNTAPRRDAMLFGVESILKTRIIYGEDDTENDEPIKASFERADADGNGGDRMGLYAFYNNFYYYYPEYGNFAESVIFTNNELKINHEGYAEYSPLRTWTFSTIYGEAPKTIDCVAYYPFRDGYNPNYVVMNYDQTGQATLEYNYTEGEKVNADKDFMISHYKYTAANAEAFRKYMLGELPGGRIPLSFKRQMASLDMQVTKHKDCNPITVTGFTIYFNAPTKAAFKVQENGAAKWDFNEDLTYTVTGLEAELKNTNWVLEPTGGYEYVADRLLKNSKLLFFPPGAVFSKIVFTIEEEISGVKEAKTYTWHPHVATVVANKHYSLNLELDPKRLN